MIKTLSVRILTSLLMFAAAIAVGPFLWAQQDSASEGGVQQMMTPEQFKSAGLEKLSPEELANLNKWLNGYREKTVKTATKRVERQAAEVTVSRVDGIFNGITGSTIVRMEDGTVWKQANSDERWRAPGLDHPPAAVYRTMFGRQMRIAGTPAFYVDPVRQ